MEEVLSISQALDRADNSLKSLGTLVLEGEISGWKGPNHSGHCYFSLKDDAATLNVIIWKSTFERLAIVDELKDGIKVQVKGAFNIYAPYGRMSFVIHKIEIAGEGALRMQVALLARKLEREGLMAPSRKKPIPRFCSRICLVTSLSGDVIQDVRRTLLRRNPLVAIEVVGCAVQGQTAAPSICKALDVAIERRPDAILLVRGGGSFEDLMCFNDEALARKIASSDVPIVTGIGHEPDTSIADMVSDRRASTPTAAAESIAPSRDELASELSALAGRMTQVLSSKTLALKTNEATLTSRFVRSMQTILSRRVDVLDGLQQRPVLRSPRGIIEQRIMRLNQSGDRLHEAMPRALTLFSRELSRLSSASSKQATQLLQVHEQKLSSLSLALDALSPLKVLERGYAIVTGSDGELLRSSSSASVRDVIHVRLCEGELEAEVSEVIPPARDVED